MNIKYFHNLTAQPLTLCFTVSEGFKSQSNTQMSYQLTLAPKEKKKVSYGDVYCNYITSLSVTYDLDGMRHTNDTCVISAVSDMANLLNNSSYIAISGLSSLQLETDA